MADRGDLLDAIKQGKKLKKTVTNDRSAPAVGGGSAKSSSNSHGSNNSSSVPPPPSTYTAKSATVSSGTVNQRLPGIGGLFGEGGVPKLRPTGPSLRSGREWTRPSVLPPEPRKAPLPIPKKTEAPPPPPLGVKPPFPSRTRSFNTGKSPGLTPVGSSSRDDSRMPRPGPPRTLKPPNHPPPPPPIPKRLSTSTVTKVVVGAGGSTDEENSSFEARFGPLFKPISSFPPPEPFTSIQKTYPSRANARKALSRS